MIKKNLLKKFLTEFRELWYGQRRVGRTISAVADRLAGHWFGQEKGGV